MPRPVTHNHSRQVPQPGWYLGEPFTIRAGQVLAAGTLDIQNHNQLAATKQQAIQRRRPRATVQYIQAKFVYYAKLFQKLFYYLHLQPEILSQPQHLSRPLQCAAVKLGNTQPCANEALSENDFCAIHLNWHNRPGHHAICRELRYVPSADSPRFQEENHAVQTQIQTAEWHELA